MKILNKITGFTLAETMIVLAIIGVVASIVIPAIISDLEKQKWSTGAKEAYSILSQAFSKSTSDAGTPGDMAASDVLSGGYNDGVSWDKFKTALNLQKDCGYNNTTGCLPPITYLQVNNVPYPAINNAETYIRAKGILSNGMFIFFHDRSGNCTYTAGNDPGCTVVQIDVNGSKGPNTKGRDLFEFWIMWNKVASGYWYQGASFCNTACSGTGGCGEGASCVQKLMQNSWEMTY